MQLGLSESLSALVAKRFTAAKEGGHLVFSTTQLANIHASGIPYQLRYCPALAKKPSAIPKSPDQDEQPKPKPDPFENPPAELLIATIPPTQSSSRGHRLVLNKFPIIPNHFILATTEWKAQTDLLEKADLEATYACIKAWGSSNGETNNSNRKEHRLFAFFNSGEDSGASQPHRHLQFLPVEAMAEQQQVEGAEDEGKSSWRPLIDAVFESKSESGSEYRYLDNLPFAHFALPLPSNPSADTLHTIYLSLYRAAVSAVKAAEGGEEEEEGGGGGGNISHAGNADAFSAAASGPAAISYNLAMTESAMMICPRRNETAEIYPPGSDDGSVVGAGVVALNGTILAGTLMVKAEAEWNELRRDPEILTSALSTVGHRSGSGRASL